MAKKQPMYGSEASVDNAAIADQKVDYAAGDLDTEAEIIVAVNATNTAINSLIAALENYGILKT
tara:strand:+ start:267 stop:458 length:192 start_codon:yes stop_codon:yes gene_type:complete